MYFLVWFINICRRLHLYMVEVPISVSVCVHEHTHTHTHTQSWFSTWDWQGLRGSWVQQNRHHLFLCNSDVSWCIVSHPTINNTLYHFNTWTVHLLLFFIITKYTPDHHNSNANNRDCTYSHWHILNAIKTVMWKKILFCCKRKKYFDILIIL